MDQRSVVMLGVGLWGLVVLAAVYVAVGGVERDLTWRSRAALAGAGLRWAEVSYSGRDATLAGVAPGAPAQGQAIALIEGLEGVRQLQNRTNLAASANE
jgi:hypothetical protein